MLSGETYLFVANSGRGRVFPARRRTTVIWLLLVMLVVIGLTSLGCVSGLRAVGWSGGAVSGGTLYVGSSEGRLVAVNLSDEGRQWSEAIRSSQSTGFGCIPTCGTGSAGVAIYGTPAVSGDLVYIGGYNGKIYAFTSENLTTRWVYPREGYLNAVVGGIAVADGKVFFGDSDGRVYALDGATGDKIWDFPTGDKIWATPAVSGGTLFIGSFDDKLYALNTADGSMKWEFATEGAIMTTPVVQDGVVYFGSFDRNFYAVSESDGSLRWKFQGGNWFWAQPVCYGDNIYAGCLDDKVYVLKAAGGGLVTDPLDLGSPVSSSPVVVDNAVIFASRQGVIYAVDTSRYGLRQLASLGADVSGPLCASGDTVYIHTQDLTLHQINVATGAVLRSISLKSTG
jgi:outer membrane protein assembly factor BamB